ncbi:MULTISPECIES: N-acetylmuramoyl-L-alanine amidase [Brasilonema]|jgi:N-acetylmuramoyl-L-alanine amidase|nr:MULTISPECIES: N-acetylmuramoyl-L-alanine amidase [Brasilonema]
MKVCIDPGHGGKGPGAIGKNPFDLKEKIANV